MLIIGLTGPTGSGKGLFCRALLPLGIPSIDLDAVYHELLVPPSLCLDALTDAFGKEILNENGTLNRKALAAIVFNPEDPEVRASRITRLNGITHGFVMDRAFEILDEMQSRGVKAAILDAPALYEAGADKHCDLNVTVLASPETRVRRIMERDKLTEAEATARVSAQHPDSFYTERADAVLTNDLSAEEFISLARRFAEERLSAHL